MYDVTSFLILCRSGSGQDLDGKPTRNPIPPEVTGKLYVEPSGLVMLLLNAGSVHTKTMYIYNMILDEGADLACIAET